MESSNNSMTKIDPNLCDRLTENTDYQNVFENCQVECDEQFKKCTNNGWNTNKKIELNNDFERDKDMFKNGSNNDVDINNVQRVPLHSGNELLNDDSIETNKIKEDCEENDRTERTSQFSPDKSAELFLKSLISDTEVLPEKTEGHIWILPPDEGAKKKNKKKKKPRA